MANIPGTILASMISPGDTIATFPTHEDIYGKGGLVALTSLSSLSSIPSERQKVGMLFYVDETSSYYKLTSVSEPLTGGYIPFQDSLSLSNSNYLSLSGGVIDGNLSVLSSFEVGVGVDAVLFVSAGKVGINTEIPNVELTVNGEISSTGIIYDANGNSTQWNDVYTIYGTNSASYATINFADSKFLPLSGGTVTGDTHFNNDVTIWGKLSAIGGTFFADTVYTTTSALSVYHVGDNAALWVGSMGTGDIASFYDVDQNVEMLHIGGHDGAYPNVGVKTSTPNVDFTVNGEISASEIIYDGSGNSIQWNSVYTTVNTNSATTWNYQGTDLKDLSANWQSTYSTVSSLSANWQTAYAYVSANSVNLTATNVFVNNNLTVTNTVSAKYYQGTLLDWMTLVRGYKITPVFNTAIGTGDVYTYVYSTSATDKTYYRYIATDGSIDAFYENFSGGNLSNLVAKKQIIL